MPYSPRTKLSCDVSACTVLTDGYVFVSSGLAANQRMPLADWEILIDGATIRDEYIPLERETEESIPLPPVEPVEAAQPEPVQTDPVGTKWRWCATENSINNYGVPINYRIAIQTKKGVLQVKQVSSSQPHGLDYERDVRPKMFETYEAWFSTLPEGTVSKTLPQDNLTPFERRKQKSAELLKSGTPEAVNKLQDLWRVSTKVCYSLNLNQRLGFSKRLIGILRDDLQNITIEQEMNEPSLRRTTARLLREIRRHKIIKATIEEDPQHADFCYSYLHDRYKQRLYAHTNTGKVQIAYDKATKTIAVKTTSGPAKFFTSLESLSAELGGEPRLSVYHYGKEIEL